VEIHSDSFESAFARIVPNEFSYLVIVTRGHLEDQAVLRWAVNTKARFIGMIGSRFKKRALFENLLEEGITQLQLNRVFSPVGIDINAILPEEIAISIVAQMIAVRRSKPGSPIPRADQ
jgi:xanthine dehydrogenase accessory factor